MSALDQPLVESSLEDFLGRVRPRLKALFAHYRIPPQDTEDLVHQALLALLYQRDRVRDPEAWLAGTLRNKCLLYWRERRRRLYQAVDTAVLESIAEPTAPHQEEVGLLYDLTLAFEQLPKHCRSLLSLRYRDGYRPLELAERLGYSPASISKVTTRCVAALTRYMAYAGPGGRKVGHD
jgi:RNA polymerase sigma factor (sigma-70 family)